MSENERLRSEIKRISKCLHYETDGKLGVIGSLFDAMHIADEALAAKPEVCVWHRKTDTGGESYGPWITSCGNEWDLQGPEGIGPFEYPDEYSFEFCPFSGCGRKIEVKE